MKWEPFHIIKLTGLIFGFLLSLFSIFLLWKEIQSVGSISFNTFFGSGAITSGNAGLFLLFFSFFIMTASLSDLQPGGRAAKSFSNAFKVFAALLVIMGICIWATQRMPWVGILLYPLSLMLLLSLSLIAVALMADSKSD